jgi:malate synthase
LEQKRRNTLSEIPDELILAVYEEIFVDADELSPDLLRNNQGFQALQACFPALSDKDLLRWVAFRTAEILSRQ